MVETKGAYDADLWSDLLARMESEVGDLSFTTADEIFATIPGYGHATREKIVNTAFQNLSVSLRVIIRGVEPRPEDVDHARDTALERIAEGVPLGSLLSGFRLSLRGIQRRLLALAPEYGTPPEQLLEWSNLLWSLGDVFSTSVTAVYRDHEITRTVADSTRRAEWIGRLVTGDLGDSELLRGAALYKVPTDVPLRILVAPFAEDAGPETDAELQRWAGRGGATLLTAVQNRAVTGILIGDPLGTVAPPEIPVALGAPASLTELHLTTVMATRVMRTALELGLTGVIDEATLSWRLAIGTSPETTALLRQRYLVPLTDSRTFGNDLLDSVRAYLENKLNVRAAAASIPVHVNTLRYRLRRFEELTGCDLAEVNTLVEVAWVIAALGGEHGL